MWRVGEVQAASNIVDEHFIATTRATLLRGRSITEQDTAEAPPVVVVNEALALKLWPGLDPLGQRLAFDDKSLEVIGVVSTGKYVMISEAPRPAFMLAYAQSYNQPVTLFIRTQIDPVTVLPEVRRVLQRLDPQLPIYSAQTMEEHLRERSGSGSRWARSGATCFN